MDQGVIRFLKAKYRMGMVQKMIDAIDRKKSLHLYPISHENGCISLGRGYSKNC